MAHRIRFAALHLGVSALVALLAALLVFGVWYPAPLHRLAGGLTLFTLLAAVDVVLGPALTLVVAHPAKPRRELRRDLAVIGALQLAGLLYGLHTISLARPAYVVFEVDRFQVVTASQLSPDDLAQARPEFRQLPWTGPLTLGAERPRSAEALMASIQKAMAGRDLALQPEHWRPLDPAVAWQAAKPMDAAVKDRPALQARAAELARSAGVDPAQLRWLPVAGRDGEALALLAPTAPGLIGYLDTPPP